jgi:HPt (histidine-containing phosphotransfer) domain-containing protein
MNDYVAKPIEIDVLDKALAAAHAHVAARRKNDAVLDPARIAQLRAIDDDASLLGEVVGAFVAEVPQLLHKLAHAVRERDGPLLAATAHYLLSSIDFVGANRMRVPCTNLELMGRADNVDDAQDELASLTEAYEEAAGALLALR